MDSVPPLVSIIVPVLNEAALLGKFLRSLRHLGGRFEIIVVDGGSSDASRVIAEGWAERVLRTSRGRAQQMNAGAAIARGDVFWFLHADLEVPRNAIEEICGALSDGRGAGGCFRVHYPRRQLVYRLSDSVGNLGVDVFGFGLGDHGIFCRREAFARAGGYSLVPILEDAELYRRLKRIGQMVQLRGRIVSDPRTFESCGPYRTTAIYLLILALYVAGAPVLWVEPIYRWFHSAKRGIAPAVRWRMFPRAGVM